MTTGEPKILRTMLALALLAASSLTLAAQEPTGSQQNVTPDRHPLVPGDAIRLMFWREPDFNGDYPVDENGSVVLPILGYRNVTDVSPAVLKESLLSEYRDQLRNQEVQITLLRRVRVLGAVHEPGLYFVDPTMTLGDAVALAGGATSDGKLNDIKIIRGGEEIRSGMDSSIKVVAEVQSGDQIMVPERSWISRKGAVVVAAIVTASALVIVALSQ
jgi:protein involved in polysaccharide export with SLBB domain